MNEFISYLGLSCRINISKLYGYSKVAEESECECPSTFFSSIAPSAYVASFIGNSHFENSTKEVV